MSIFDDLPTLPNDAPPLSNFEEWSQPIQEISVTEIPDKSRLEIPELPDIISMPVPGLIGAISTAMCGGALLSLIPGSALLLSPIAFGGIALAFLLAGKIKDDRRFAPMALLVIMGLSLGNALITTRSRPEIVTPEVAPVQFSNPMVEGQ